MPYNRPSSKGYAYVLIMIFAILLGSLAVLTLELVESQARLSHAARHRITAWYILNHTLHRLIWAQNNPVHPVRPLQDSRRWRPTVNGWSRLVAPPWPSSTFPSMNVPYHVSIQKRMDPPVRDAPGTVLRISVTVGAQNVTQTVRLNPLPLDTFPLGLGPRASGPPLRTWLHSSTAHTMVDLKAPFSIPSNFLLTTLWLPPQIPPMPKLSPAQLRRTPPWPPLKRWFTINFNDPELRSQICPPGQPLVLPPARTPSKTFILDSLDLCQSQGLVYRGTVLIPMPPGFNGIIVNQGQTTVNGTLQTPCRNPCRDPVTLWIINPPQAELLLHSPIRTRIPPNSPCPPRIVILNFGTLNIRFLAPDPHIQVDLFSAGSVTLEADFGLTAQWVGTLYFDGPYDIRAPLRHSPSPAPFIPIRNHCPFHHWVWDVHEHTNPFAPPSGT